VQVLEPSAGRGNRATFVLTDSANSAVAYGNSGPFQTSTNYVNEATNTVTITTAAAATYKLRWLNDGATWTIINSTGTGSGSYSSTISWKKISGYLPVSGQTADFAYARPSTFPGAGSTGDVTIPSLSSGNIPLASNLFTLTAGKTYRLDAQLACSGAAGFITYTWMDSSNTLLPNANDGFCDPSPSSDSGNDAMSSVVYTPSVTTQVKVRVSSSNTATALAARSYVTITQIGTTAMTGVTMSYLTAALANNSLDNAGFTQTWSWNSLGANNGLVLSSSDAAGTGALFGVTSSTAGATTNGVIRFNLTGAGTRSVR
jgi:hypothetical protein